MLTMRVAVARRLSTLVLSHNRLLGGAAAVERPPSCGACRLRGLSPCVHAGGRKRAVHADTNNACAAHFFVGRELSGSEREIGRMRRTASRESLVVAEPLV